MSRTRGRPAALIAVVVVSLIAIMAAVVSCGTDASVVPPDAGADVEAGAASSDASTSPADAGADGEADAPFVEPDENEPNDAVPTPIPLVEDGGVQTGRGDGVLATPGDVDRFTFDVPSGTHVVYARITAPALVPETSVRLRYELSAPGAGAPLLASGEATDRGAVDLGTARLVTTAAGGACSLVVSGVAPEGGVADGDPRLAYDVDVRILPVEDALEPNDSRPTSVVRAIANASASSTRFTGRVGWIGDEDWFRVDLAPSIEPTLLSYRLGPSGAGRFPRLPGPNGIRLRAMTGVPSGATECKTSARACPKGYETAAPGWASQVEALCDAPEGAACLQSARVEHAPHVALSNFGGAIPIPPHASTIAVWFVVDDADGDGADDVPFALDVTWSADPDEAARTSGAVEQAMAFSLAADPGTTYPLPAPDVAPLTGRLTYGFGLKDALDPSSPEAVRGPDDYDAIASDEDVYLMQLPSLAPPEDRTWTLSWVVETEAATAPAYDLVVDVTFCDGDALDAGKCTEVSTHGDGTPLRFSSPGALVPWPARPNGAPIPHFTEATSSAGALDAGTLVTTATSTARPEACFCLEPRFVRGGYARLRVRAVDRRSYAPSRYSIRTSFVSYPRDAACVAPVQLDAGGFQPGCRFAK